MVGVWHVVRLYVLSSVLRDLGSLLSIYGIDFLSFAIAFSLSFVCFPRVKTQPVHHHGRWDHAIAASRLLAELDVSIRNLRLSRSGC